MSGPECSGNRTRGLRNGGSMKRSLKQQRGVALLFSLFALFLLTAIALGLVFMSNTESSVNANYRSDQALYFAAKAGVEEARNRMMVSNPASLMSGPNCPNAFTQACLPAVPDPAGPTGANKQITYLINEGANPGSVQPWSSPTVLYGDNELCHDGYAGLGITPQS